MEARTDMLNAHEGGGPKDRLDQDQPTLQAAGAMQSSPSEGSRATRWLNLGVVALLAIYVILTGWQILGKTTCGQLAVDYCVFLSAGRVANTHGYAGIYEPGLMEQAERSVWGSTGNAFPTPVMRFLYLPVFAVPFQMLSRVSPQLGFWIWTAINLAALLFYARFLLRRLELPAASARLMLMMMASLPLYMSLSGGQVGVWLLICAGEFMRAHLEGKPFRAGLWLGGLLLKPQVLVLLVPILLLRAAWKELAGFVGSTAALSFVSLLLAGPAGLMLLLKAWLAMTSGDANAWVLGMMNWRMLGAHASILIAEWAGWGLTGLGILATTAAVLYLWRRPEHNDPRHFVVTLLGILAATTLVAWHSHIHVAVMLIAPLLYLYQSKVLPLRLLAYWVFAPAFAYVLLLIVPAALVKLNLVSGDVRGPVYLILGATQFSANLALFLWAAVKAQPGPSGIRGRVAQPREAFSEGS